MREKKIRKLVNECVKGPNKWCEQSWEASYPHSSVSEDWGFAGLVLPQEVST